VHRNNASVQARNAIIIIVWKGRQADKEGLASSMKAAIVQRTCHRLRARRRHSPHPREWWPAAGSARPCAEKACSAPPWHVRVTTERQTGVVSIPG